MSLTIEDIKTIAKEVISPVHPLRGCSLIDPPLCLRCQKKYASAVKRGDIVHVDIFDPDQSPHAVHLMEKSIWAPVENFELT
jgi:hypothetical protein